MDEYLPIIIVTSGFILTTLISAVEAYHSSQETPAGPSSGSATPPLARYNYGSSDSPNSYLPSMESGQTSTAAGAAQTSTRKILQPSFMTERSQKQQERGGGLPPQYSTRQRGSMGDQTRKTVRYDTWTISG